MEGRKGLTADTIEAALAEALEAVRARAEEAA